MKPYHFNLINSISLFSIGLWGYLSSETPSFTALIPVIFGLILIIFTKGLKQEKKIQSHIVVVLTILVLIGLVKPFTASLGRGNYMAIFRVSFMMITSIIAIISFINSFILARKSND